VSSLKTGVKSPVAALKEGSKRKNVIDVQQLFLDPVEEYLRRIAPGVTEEEYYVFEQMIEEYPDEEDRVIQEITRLQTQGQSLVQNQRIELEEGDDSDSDSDSDESQFKKTHKLKECLPSGAKRVYNKLDFSADEEAARKRFQERYTKLSD
jgi:hypothetical protein